MPDSGSRTYILTFMVVSLQICKSIRDVKQRVAPNSWSEHCRLCIQLWSCKYLIYFNSWLAFIFPLKHGWLLTLYNINDKKACLCVRSLRTNSMDISCYDVIRNDVKKGKFEMIKSNLNSNSCVHYWGSRWAAYNWKHWRKLYFDVEILLFSVINKQLLSDACN